MLRLNFSGVDLTSLGQELLARAAADAGDACALMDAAAILQFKGSSEIALAMQREALATQQCYSLPAATQPARLRVAALMAPGDLMANVPLECLLEDSDVDLHLYYVLPDGAGADTVPAHDVLFVALGVNEANTQLLHGLSQVLADWPQPVVNHPDRIGRLERDRASRLLADIPEIAMPPTVKVARSVLTQLVQGATSVEALLPDHGFPIIVRPLDSHAGHDLHRIDGRDALAQYLGTVSAENFFISPFIDYRSADGQFRKFRIALVDGRPFPCHMAISSHWMIHYLNAGMADSAAKREEEARFMTAFDEDFARRHAAALSAIHRRMGLEYVCIDCAETADGRLLIFEVDHAMIVHALDPADVYPYKEPQMRKVFRAFREMLGRRAAGGNTWIA